MMVEIIVLSTYLTVT